MDENLHEFLYQIAAILIFIAASMLFWFIVKASFQMKEAFQTAYNTQGTLWESKTALSEEDWVKGSDIIFSIYYGIECPITVEGIEISENEDVIECDLSIIDKIKKYKRSYQINEHGRVIKVNYY